MQRVKLSRFLAQLRTVPVVFLALAAFLPLQAFSSSAVAKTISAGPPLVQSAVSTIPKAAPFTVAHSTLTSGIAALTSNGNVIIDTAVNPIDSAGVITVQAEQSLLQATTPDAIMHLGAMNASVALLALIATLCVVVANFESLQTRLRTGGMFSHRSLAGSLPQSSALRQSPFDMQSTDNRLSDRTRTALQA
jgi:hypothetical protein